MVLKMRKDIATKLTLYLTKFNILLRAGQGITFFHDQCTIEKMDYMRQLS